MSTASSAIARVARRMRASPRKALAGLVFVPLIAIQFVPYGRAHANGPVTGEPDWSPRTRELMVRACFDCHSNEVEWQWYSNVAPLSWIVTNHVEEGRDEVNYSEFATSGEEADDTIETILEGEMPPGYYTLFGLHGDADLNDAEVDELVAGLRATPGMSEGRESEDRESEDDESDEDEHDDEEDDDD